jgi:protein-S-isoprenylcysteine O-methyltransferase Ste14
MQITLPYLIAYALWIVLLISWNARRRQVQTISTPEKKRERAYGLVTAFGIALIAIPPVVPKIWVSPPLIDWLLLIPVFGGFAFCWWARVHLGELWSADVTRKEGHRIVETGPYRLVRHPIYTGFIVFYGGIALLCATGLSLIAITLLTIGFWLKASLEEQFLCEELGPTVYAEYRARTPMLIPRLRL